MKIALPPARYDTDRKKAAFFSELAQRTQTVPGVRSATVALYLPTTNWLRTNIHIAGQTEDPHQGQFGLSESVTPGYFDALGIPLLRGRAFTDRDNRPGAPPVTVVNEILAHRIWPEYPGGPNPVGQLLIEGAGKAAGPMEGGWRCFC
jgi:hypothetical protein